MIKKLINKCYAVGIVRSRTKATEFSLVLCMILGFHCGLNEIFAVLECYTS